MTSTRDQYLSSTRSSKGIVDDEDLRIQYSGDWSRSLITNRGESVTETKTVGDSATLIFTGTQVEVWVVEVASILYNATYVIDDGPPTVYISISNIAFQRKKAFTRDLPPGRSHTLVITNYGSSLGLHDIWVNGTAQVATATTTTTQMLEATSFISTASVQSTSSIPDASTSGRRDTHAATIAGATIGTVILLFALTAGILICCRRRRHRREAAVVVNQSAACSKLSSDSSINTPRGTNCSSGARTPGYPPGRLSFTSTAYPTIPPVHCLSPASQIDEEEEGSDVWEGRMSRGYSIENPPHLEGTPSSHGRSV
ncbi:hypothetical protein C8Q76DRAFT_113795 [Earliella scabrosa]|nr:hypothetical protein C8Q76DRAFT_113795 [Earliella scabrosa]